MCPPPLRDPDDGFDIGDLLGMEVRGEIGRGEDGVVYWLDDERIMKVSHSATEAAICLGLMEAQEEHGGHPGVPWISLVAVHECDACIALPDGTPHPYVSRRYVIVREDMSDVRVPDQRLGGWRLDLDSIAGWAGDGWEGPMPDLVSSRDLQEDAASVAAAMRWVEATTGARLVDLRPPNVGRTERGDVGMRDLGRAHDVRPDLMERVREGGLPATHEVFLGEAPRP